MLYQIDLGKIANSQRLQIERPEALGVTEKAIEDFFASRPYELLPEDQLMLIGQERQRQEEADLLALDRRGRLYIFELKRWQSNTENLLQVLRYGQIFGRYSYDQLQDLARRHQKLEGELRERHREHFELERHAG
jgi:RecB family endonuclease NucS